MSTVITQCRTVRTVLEAMLQGPCGPREWHRTPSSVRPLFMLVPPNLGACLPGTVPRTIFVDQVGCSLVLALSGMNHMKHCWAVISQLFTCCPTPGYWPRTWWMLLGLPRRRCVAAAPRGCALSHACPGSSPAPCLWVSSPAQPWPLCCTEALQEVLEEPGLGHLLRSGVALHLNSGDSQKGGCSWGGWVGGGEMWKRWWSLLSGAGANLEPLQLQAGAPVEGQSVTPVPAQLGRHVQALVLQLVVERADAEVLQGVGCKRLPCGKGPWAQQLPSPMGLCRQDAGAEERRGLPAGEAGSAEELTRAGGSSPQPSS